MCKDMLEPIADGTPAQKLRAAQNYVQEIKLIERAMREAAADEAASRGTDRYYSHDESLILFRTIAQTSEHVPALAQYDGAGGNGTGGVEPSRRQAAAAASAGEDSDAPIPERLRKKETALKKAGASATKAAAGGRCSLEVDVLDEHLDEMKGLYEIRPLMPEKMGHRDTEQGGLVVEPVTKERFEEIRQQHRDIAEASKSVIDCVRLTDRMKATLAPWHSEELAIHRHQPSDIRKLSSSRDAIWGWAITARQTGKPKLQLDLRYAISRKTQQFRLVPQSPVYDEAIKVTSLQGDSPQEATERPWWQRIFRGISEWISGLFGD